jgi:hypothetical protein
MTAIAFCLLVGCQSQPPIPTPTPVQPPANQEGRVQSPIGTGAILGADRTALDDYGKAQDEDIALSKSGKPQAARAAMTGSGRVATVDNETRVLVLEVDGPQTRVRVLDGASAGREGWVYSGVVVRPRPL